jgi:hypothetical protein
MLKKTAFAMLATPQEGTRALCYATPSTNGS